MLRSSTILFLTCSALLASNTPIGFVTVIGSMRVDGSEIRENATILEGTSLETYVNPARVALKSGTQLELAAEGSARIYGDRIVLEKGFAQLHASSRYSIFASSLRVVPKNASTLRIGYASDKAVEVSVVRGEAQILNKEGALVASVMPNHTIELTPEENGPGAESNLTGQLTKSGGHYYLNDSASNVTYELKGENLDTAVGNCINITGHGDPTNTAQGASERIDVTGYQVASGCFVQSGASAGPLPDGNKSAVIAGVSGAVAILTVAPLAMAGAFSSGKVKPVSPQ